MANQSTVIERLRFNLIDDQTIATLRQAKDFILAEMPAILDRFYDHVAGFPGDQRRFGAGPHLFRDAGGRGREASR